MQNFKDWKNLGKLGILLGGIALGCNGLESKLEDPIHKYHVPPNRTERSEIEELTLHHRSALALKEHGDLEGAIKEFQYLLSLRELSLWPAYNAEVNNDFGVTLYKKGDLTNAM